MRRGPPFMLAKFLSDRRGNFALATVGALLPIMGALALAVDYSEMNRQKQATTNALDAAGLATARQVAAGASDAALILYANEFFKANLGPVDPNDTQLTVVLPNNLAGGGTLKLTAQLNYQPYFFPAFSKLIGKSDAEANADITFSADSEIRLKNTLEVALVLDNSGSMNFTGTGSGQKRIDLLKAAAKQLVDTLVLQAAQIKQVDKPVQFALVPFAASVNVGPENADAAWMDVEGLSPTHQENFDWSTLDDPDKRAEKTGGIWYKKGSGWGDEQDQILSRYSLYKDMKKVAEREWVATGQEWVCTRWRDNGTCRDGYWRETGYYEETLGPYASWQGCVESRPYPYALDDTPPAGGTANTGIGFGDPATMFVPMFGPDEPGDRWATAADSDPDGFNASNNWWNDGTESSTGSIRQKNMKKYFEVRPWGATSPQGTGPNYSCTTSPITPLTDVTIEAGVTSIKAAIDRMAPNGATNVPEGMAWGWRAVSSGTPFTQGRPDTERGNDKVVIVLTDGENTYYTPGSLGYGDPADSKSIYSSHGYLKPGYNGSTVGRLFSGTSAAIGQFDYSNANYTAAMNEHLATLCNNAKAANILVMTVSLDLSTLVAGENKAITALKNCASNSRFRKDPDDPTKPAKLFYNATGSNLSQKFKEIADELSNLRIVG
jgi:Flp pilus assembly protein TadG